MREFESGATRNSADNKPRYAGYLSEYAMLEYGAYMLKHQRQKDGKLRAPDNWKKGIDEATYVDSLLRHAIHVWQVMGGCEVIDPDTGGPVNIKDALCGVRFNADGLLHEIMKKETKNGNETNLSG